MSWGFWVWTQSSLLLFAAVFTLLGISHEKHARHLDMQDCLSYTWLLPPGFTVSHPVLAIRGPPDSDIL